MNARTRTPAAHGAADSALSTPNQPLNAPQVMIAKERGDIDTSDIDLSIHDKSIELGAELSLEELRDQLNAGVGAAEMPTFADHAANLAFMEEQVLVRVHTSTEPHSERVVEVYNDGKPQFFIRGEWVIARRKYVEVLARAVPYGVTTPEALDARGDKTRRIEKHYGARYTFDMKDRNPKGAAWLNALLMEQ